MLFLFNDLIVNVDAPEAHLARRWKALGCGEPHSMLARDALDFVRAVVGQHRSEGMEMDAGLVADLSSLIIAKTGANAALFLDRANGDIDARLTQLPQTILQALLERKQGGADVPLAEIWPLAA